MINKNTTSQKASDASLAEKDSGKVALITGANTGIGAVTASSLAQRGYEVYLACKSLDRTQPIIDQINQREGSQKAFFIELDLADFESVRNCARQFLATGKPLNVLINNAGIAGKKGKTLSGFEMAFGVNHLGHFLLTQLLLDCLKLSAPSKIITVASRAHKRAPQHIHWQYALSPSSSWTGIPEYALSKLANIQFSSELANQLKGTGVSSYSLHPGVVDTQVWRELPGFLRPLIKLRGMLTPEQGAMTTLHCALKAHSHESGLYFSNSQVETPSAMALDVELQQKLWQLSLEWTQNYL